MKIQINYPHLADLLVDSLNETGCLAVATNADAVDVLLPWLEAGGDGAQARTEVLFFVRAWGMKHPGFDVRLD
jgi:hypothetical protein